MSQKNFTEKTPFQGESYGYFAFTWSKASDAFLLENKYKKIDLKGQFGDMSFLEKFADTVEEVKVINDDSLANGISYLTKLKRLSIKFKPKKPFDMSKLVNLEYFFSWWNNNYLKDLFTLPKLRELSILSYDEENFKNITPNKSIVELTLHQPKIKNLKCINNLDSLKKLEIRKARSLITLSGIEDQTKLERLDIFVAKKINDCSFIGSLTHLKRLSLTDVGGLDDLSFLKHLRNIEELDLTGIPVKLNWKEIIKLKKLKRLIIVSLAEDAPTDEEIVDLAKKAGKECKSVSRQGRDKMPMIDVRF